MASSVKLINTISLDIRDHEIVIFDSLSTGEIRQIVDLMLRPVEERLMEHGVTMSLSDRAKDWLGKEGFDSEFGARPLRRNRRRGFPAPAQR